MKKKTKARKEREREREKEAERERERERSRERERERKKEAETKRIDKTTKTNVINAKLSLEKYIDLNDMTTENSEHEISIESVKNERIRWNR